MPGENRRHYRSARLRKHIRVHDLKYLARVGFVERLTGEAGGDEVSEVRAGEDVLVGTAQGMIEGHADGSRSGDLLIDLGQLALHEPPPLGWCNRPRGQECLLLGE